MGGGRLRCIRVLRVGVVGGWDWCRVIICRGYEVVIRGGDGLCVLGTNEIMWFEMRCDGLGIGVRMYEELRLAEMQVSLARGILPMWVACQLLHLEQRGTRC